ncbi:MAG: hypothetical protein GXZ11_05600 [Tissierellia bacterium]|nr:hypothetical protein [Tissierellia bacterium]
MRGERFKKNLPKFIGQIPDFDDLFYAEDQEFIRVDKRVQEVLWGSFINSITRLENPNPVLDRLDEIFGLKKTKSSVNDRIQRLSARLRSRAVTTRELIVSICKGFGYYVRFVKEYENYMFRLEVINDSLTTNVLDSIDIVVPAHLGINIWVCWHTVLTLNTAFAAHRSRRYKCGEITCGIKPYVMNCGERIEATLDINAGEYTAKDWVKKVGQHKTKLAPDNVNYTNVQQYEALDEADIFVIGEVD